MQKNAPVSMLNQRTKKAPRAELSYNAKRAIITGAMLVGLVLVVLLIYYPSIFPWKH